MNTAIEVALNEQPRIDLLIHREILRLRAQYQLSLDEFRGLYISDQQVDRLINQVFVDQHMNDTVDQITERAEQLGRVTGTRRLNEPVWRRLREEYRLSEFELDVLCLALAPHVEAKYETLYAYLNNDVTRKWLTCDLALRLLCSSQEERLAQSEQLMSHAPLMRDGLLQPIAQTGERASWLSTGLTLMPGLVSFLLGSGFQSPEFMALAEVRTPQQSWEDLTLEPRTLMECRRWGQCFVRHESSSPLPVVVVEGRDESAAIALVEAWCRDLDIPILAIDAGRFRVPSDQIPKIGRHLVLQQRVMKAGVVVYGMDVWLDKEGHVLPEARHLIADLAEHRTLMVVVLKSRQTSTDWLPQHETMAVRLEDPGASQRQALWQRYLQTAGIMASNHEVAGLAERFILSGEQIRRAVSSAKLAYAGGADGQVESRALFGAARAQSGHALAQLAVKVECIHSWDELVLHPVTRKRVKDVAAAVKHRQIVYERWGFERRLGTGTGLKVLFAGASGTGKTMTASVIANDLELDLYKIDLQGVVSKYIGETEKNLERIFRAAYCSNAILFFDEADALFGKRSEVKDAHDRYANIEVSYLLQKMEDYDGVVILASNWSKNIDDAFLRRMQYVVDFPLPDEEQRLKLWQGMLPAELPLGDDVDVKFLAKQFAVPGGDIKNVALDAAFLAAQDGKVVTMKQLIQAMGRQQAKQGRIPSVADFKQHFAVIIEE